MDDVDLAIVSALQRDGRMSNRRLAERVGLSASACLERVRRLCEAGVIAGYAAIVGDTVTRGLYEGWAHITLQRRTEAQLERVIGLLRECEFAIAVYELAGASDLLVHVLAPDAETWRGSVCELEAHEGVGVRTSPVTRTAKRPSPLPLDKLWSTPGAPAETGD